MSPDPPDDTRSRETDFAAMWSSDGATRSFSPSATGTGLPADMPFLFAAGQRFGAYQIIRPLGKGGMGQVYEAEETDSGRRIAMKILSRGLGDDEERERFLREGQLAASLSHPNTVYVYGTTEIQGFPVIAMELAPGGTLKERVADQPPLPFAAAVDAILQVIAGLDAAASIGILHRDIKPSNCFVHGDGRVLIGDFGLSVATSGRGGSVSNAGTILGTPGFASPEQLRGGTLDVRSDIYAVGATIFYLLAGRAPFDDNSTTALIARVETQPPPPLTEVRPDVPARLSAIVARCLAKDPDVRYPDYAALASALEPFSSTRLRSAPLMRRLLAGWIDLYVAAFPVIALMKVSGLQPLSPSHLFAAFGLMLTAIGVMVLYYGLFEGRAGATPAKALFGLRVVDAANVPPGVSRAMHRALVFGLPLQITTRLVAFLALLRVPDVSLRPVTLTAGAACLAALFSIARRSNGYTAWHDRLTSTRVVLKRELIEARKRQERAAPTAVPAPPGDTRIGPYLVLEGTSISVSAPVSIEGHDDRLGRRVWIDLLPPGSPAVGALRRDLGRPGRVRWLAGRRDGVECWDAYEAIDGEPVELAAASPQPWTRVRHWLLDLAVEAAAGLDDGSLPALHSRRVWIGRDDRARIVDWSNPGSGDPLLDPEAVAPEVESVQRLLYSVGVAALLGVPPESARTLDPATPLPMAARGLLLNLRDAKFQSAQALVSAVSAAVNGQAMIPASRRGAQIALSASLPLLTVVVTILSIVFASARTGLDKVASPLTLWTTALAVGAGMFAVIVPFALLGALIFRGGLTLRLFGAAVVNRRGEPAARVRALWRAIVTWSPAFVLLLMLRGKSFNGTDLRPWMLSLGVAAFAAGALWTALHSSRSIQDRLAGTWIVPR